MSVVLGKTTKVIEPCKEPDNRHPSSNALKGRHAVRFDSTKHGNLSHWIAFVWQIFHNSQAAQKVDDTLCFSIVTPSRTVDLQARNPELRTRWSVALMPLCLFVAGTKDHKSLSRVTGLSLLFATQTRKTSRDGNNSLKGSSSRTQSGSQASRSRQSGNGFRGSLKVFNFGSQKSWKFDCQNHCFYIVRNGKNTTFR